MTDNSEYSKLDESFFNDGYNLAKSFIAGNLTKQNLFLAQKQLYKVIDEVIDGILTQAEKSGKKSHCRMGCSFCCNQIVLAMPYELFYLATHITNKFTSEQVLAIIQVAENKLNNTSSLSLEPLLRYKAPCPLLHPKGGFCRAYQARPMACRIYLSSDLQSCKDDLANPDDDSIFPQLFEMPLRLGRMLNEGFHAYLRQVTQNKIQAFEQTIESGLLNAFKEGNFEFWLKGKEVFHKL
jgi:Fe-S-cluster containining protein